MRYNEDLNPRVKSMEYAALETYVAIRTIKQTHFINNFGEIN